MPLTPSSRSSMTDVTATAGAALHSKAPSEKPSSGRVTPSAPVDLPAGTKPLDKDPEAQPEEKEDKYLHGLPLVLVFVGLSLAMFIIVLDQTILISAIPVIASRFKKIDQIGWITSSYFVTQCASILLWGQALAYFNQKYPLLMAIGIFEIGSLIAGVAQNFTTLIVGRAVAGLGGAAILVATISISSVVIELKRRPVFFGLFGIMFVLGSSLGPIIGGLFTTHATWRWCFYINLPIGGISMAVVAFVIPNIELPPRAPKETPFTLRTLRKAFGEVPRLSETGLIARIVGLDWVASIIVLGGVVSLTLALTDGGAYGWSNHTVIIGFVIAGVALIFLILWELLVMKEDGMIPLRVTKFRSVWGSAGVSFCRMMNSFVIFGYLPTYFQATRHETAIKSSVSSLPYAIGMAIFGMMGAVLVQKSGRFKWALVLGSAVGSVGAGIMYTLDADTKYAKIAGFQIVAAFGAGLVMMNGMLAAQAEMDANGLPADIPQATALVSLIQLLGGSIGSSIGGAVLTSGLRRYGSSLDPSALVAILQSVDNIWVLPDAMKDAAVNAYARAMDDVFVCGAAAGALGVVFALICKDRNIKGKNFKG